MTSLIRVLIAEDDNQLARRLSDYMRDRGFDVRVANSGREARQQIREWGPRFVLADLMLPEGNALSLIDFVKADKVLRAQTHVLVTSVQNFAANVRQAVSRGAKDFLVKPFKPEDVVKRLIFHSRGYRSSRELAAKDYHTVDESSLMLHLTDLVLRQALSGGNLQEILFNLTRMVSMKVEGVRCSIIHCLDQHRGLVVTSNDDRKASGIALDLYKYPEVLHVLNTQSVVAVENLKESSELRQVLAVVKDIAFNSMIVCPVSRESEAFGVLSLRMPPEKLTVSDNEIRFVEIVAHVISLVLGGKMHKESANFWIKDELAPVTVVPLRSAKNS